MLEIKPVKILKPDSEILSYFREGTFRKSVKSNAELDYTLFIELHHHKELVAMVLSFLEFLAVDFDGVEKWFPGNKWLTKHTISKGMLQPKPI